RRRSSPFLKRIRTLSRTAGGGRSGAGGGSAGRESGTMEKNVPVTIRGTAAGAPAHTRSRQNRLGAPPIHGTSGRWGTEYTPNTEGSNRQPQGPSGASHHRLRPCDAPGRYNRHRSSIIGGVREHSVHDLGKYPPGLFPQVVVHIPRRF